MISLKFLWMPLWNDGVPYEYEDVRLRELVSFSGLGPCQHTSYWQDYITHKEIKWKKVLQSLCLKNADDIISQQRGDSLFSDLVVMNTWYFIQCARNIRVGNKVVIGLRFCHKNLVIWVSLQEVDLVATAAIHKFPMYGSPIQDVCRYDEMDSVLAEIYAWCLLSVFSNKLNYYSSKVV